MVDWRLRLLSWVSDRMRKPVEAVPPAVSRAQMREAIRSGTPFIMGRPQQLATVEDRELAGVRTRVYRPSSAPAPAVVYFHGGGWVVGDLETHDGVCRALAKASGAVVVAVDYRLAPEHAFPAALDDALAVTRHVAANGAALGLLPGVLAVAGDSAGGNLAAVVALKARDEALALRGQLLVYPVIECASESASYEAFAKGPFLTRENMRFFIRTYLPRAEDRARPDASPARAASTAGVAPALVVTAEADVLRDEGLAYVEKLRGDGVAVEHVHGEGMIHGFLNMQSLGVPRSVLARSAGWLRERLA